MSIPQVGGLSTDPQVLGRHKLTSPKDMVGNKLVFSKDRVVEIERPMRCIIPPRVSTSQGGM